MKSATTPRTKTAQTTKAKAVKTSVAPKTSTVSKPAKALAAPQEVAPAKPHKLQKEKLVRDSFTMPETEFAQIAAIKKRAMAFQREVKKSEVLRAGLRSLQGLSEPQLKSLLEALPVIKTGRPKKGR